MLLLMGSWQYPLDTHFGTTIHSHEIQDQSHWHTLFSVLSYLFISSFITIITLWSPEIVVPKWASRRYCVWTTNRHCQSNFAPKGLAKLGNIVAETTYLMFPGVAKLGNICFGRKICVRKAKHFFVPEQQNWFPQHMFPARLNWETFASATMFPSLARP